jgi:hypothetical protein
VPVSPLRARLRPGGAGGASSWWRSRSCSVGALLTRRRPGHPVAVAAATLAAAALFNPIRRRVQHTVDRRFNRARYDADRTVAAFAARLKDAVDLDAVRGDLATVVQTALEPAHISIWTSQPDWSSRNPAGPVTSDVAVEVRAAGGGDNDSRITD